MHRLIVPSLFVVFAGCAMLPPSGRIAMRDHEFRLVDRRLPSGLRVIIEEDHSVPMVGVVTVVGTGSANDPDGKEGLAHFLEHLAFRSKPDGRTTLWDAYELLGASGLNAMTDLDTTTYFAYAPKEGLKELLRVQGAQIASPMAAVDQVTFDVEREVVRNELRQRDENGVVGQAFSSLYAMAFPKGHRYSRPVGGSHESLSAIALTDVEAFAQKYYRPDNVTLLVIGDVDARGVLNVLQAALPPALLTARPGQVAQAPGSRLSPTPPPVAEVTPKEGLERQVALVDQPMLWLGWTLPRGFDDDSVLHTFAARALTGAASQAVMTDADITGLSCFDSPGLEASMLLCVVELRDGSHPEKSREHVLNTLVDVWLSTDSDAQERTMRDKAMDRSRLQAVVSTMMSAADWHSRGPERAQLTHITGDPLVYGRQLRGLRDIDPGRVESFAAKYLTRARAHSLLLTPLEAGARPSSLSTGIGASAAAADERPGSTRTPAEVEQLASHMVPADVRAFTLENGLSVVLVPRAGLPVVSLALAIPSGAATAEPRGAAMLADLVGEPRSRAHGRPADVGGLAGVTLGDDLTMVSMSGAAGNLPNLLANLSDWVGSMAVESSAMSYVQRDLVPALAKLDERPAERAERATWKALYGEHPLGTRPTAALLEQAGEGDAESWMGRVFRPEGATLVISGELDGAKAEEAVRRWLSGWSGGRAPEMPKVPRSAHPPKVVVTHKPGATQGDMTVACLLPEPTPAQSVANEVLAEIVSARLHRKLREVLGGTYGVHGRASAMTGGAAHLWIEGAVDYSKLGAALKMVKGELDADSVAGTDADLADARWTLARGWSEAALVTANVASGIATRLARGATLEDLRARPKALTRVDRAAVDAAWKTCRETAVVSLLGDEPTVKKALGEAGLQ